MPQDVAGFVTRLHEDAAFRRRFAGEPAAVLAEAGLDPETLNLPPRIDEKRLAERLDTLFSGKAAGARRAPPAALDPQQLWDRFGAIGLKPAALGEDPPIVAVVVYGASMVTSQGSRIDQASVMSVDQLKTLRTLAHHPQDQLRFAVTGKDGSSVEGMTVPMLKAFLERMP